MRTAIYAIAATTYVTAAPASMSDAARLRSLGYRASEIAAIRPTVASCVEINQCVGCTRQFFTKSFLGDDAAVLVPSSGEEPAPPRHRAGVASMA